MRLPKTQTSRSLPNSKSFSDWRGRGKQGRFEKQEKGGEACHHCHCYVRPVLASDTGCADYDNDKTNEVFQNKPPLWSHLRP